MATSNHYDASEDFTVCPVCFEKFQTPRFLPCTHSFCHRCLSAHIESSCKDCDPALGFPCPMCRVFVPAPGILRQYPIEEWASRFPENVFLSSCIRKHTSLTNILCGPCKIDCEIDIKAESWCVECEDSLCEKCSQNHRKYKALQSHQIFPITNYGLDYTRSLKLLETDILKCCEKNENRNIEFVCGTHQTGCCSLCVVKEHKHCEKIYTLLKAVDTFSDKAKVKLVQEIKDLLSKIETIILNEKQNISEVDDRSDTFSEMIKKMVEEMVIRLKTQEKTYLDKLAEVSKHARQKLEGSLELLEHRKLYLTHWLEKIVSTDSSNKETEHVLNCLKTNKVLVAVKGLPLIQMNFDLSAEVSCGVEKIISLGTLFSAKLTENNINFSDIQNETIEGKLETPNSSISNAKKSSEWFSCSEKAEISSEWESCSMRTKDSRELYSSSKKVEKSYECDVRSKKAEKSREMDICSEKAEKSRERDSCSKLAEISREWTSSFENGGKSCDWDVPVCSKEAVKSRKRDICSEEAEKSRERDSSKLAEISREWNSNSDNGRKSCKWNSGFKKEKKFSEMNSGSEKGKTIYREWNSGYETTDKSCLPDSQEVRKSREWGTGFQKVEKFNEWDSRSKKAGKFRKWDPLPQEVEKSGFRISCSQKADKSRKWDSCSQKVEKSPEWDICLKTAEVACKSDSCLTPKTVKSRKWDVCSEKEENSNELDSCVPKRKEPVSGT